MIQAEDGNEAWEMVITKSPNLVVLDILMPGMTGIEVCKKIKAEDSTKDTKVLLLTAKGQEKDKEEGLAAGADAFMAKPFHAKELLGKIEELLGN